VLLEKTRPSIETIERNGKVGETKQSPKQSDEFMITRGREFVVRHRRGADINELMRLVLDFSRGRGEVIKAGRKTRLAFFETKTGEVLIKGYERLSFLNRVGALLGWSRGHKSWRASLGLAVRGIETPQALALVVKKRHFFPEKVYFVSRSTRPLLELDRFILRHKNAPDLLDRLVYELAESVGGLHRNGIYHGDLKSMNIVIGKGEDGGMMLSFLDLDRVLFLKRVSVRRRAKNLSQLFITLPIAIDARRRREFLSIYLRSMGERGSGDKIIARTGEILRGRMIHHVGLDGQDIYEDTSALFNDIFGR